MRNTRNTQNKRHASVALLLTVLALAAANAKAQSDEVLALDIPPQDAGTALITLAKFSGVQIVLASEAAKVEVEGLKGEYRLEEALAALLTDTGLAYEFASDNVVAVRQVPDEDDGDRTEEVPAEETPAETPAEDDEPVELEPQTVTGSRLTQGDPTALVYTFTAEDIARRGVSNLEELFRTVPWNFSTINTQTNMGTQRDSIFEDTDVYLGELGLGASTINLRALGSANTLVLINGRRVAGLAGWEEDLVNLLNVPLSAIERVEIQLDGSSAVYGADAIGGVVNFVTKKNYRGLSASVRNELSATDANKSNASLQFGYAWGSGNMTATVSRDTSKPINNFKLGTETRDYTKFFGPEFDLRYPVRSGQPGVVCDWNGLLFTPGCDWRTPNYRQLPPGHNGVGATEDDFTTDLHPTRPINPKNGEDSSILSYHITAEQNLTDWLQVYADVLFSDHEATQSSVPAMHRYLIPSTNAYNPFGRHVVVHYWPLKEVADGNLPDQYTYAENKQRNYNVGLIWDVGEHNVQFNVTRSQSERAAWQFGSSRYGRSYFDPNASAFYAALASPDPEVALNLFGDGSVQGRDFAGLYSVDTGPHTGANEVNARELSSRGRLFGLWGGPVSYAAGVETREADVHQYKPVEVYRAENDPGVFTANVLKQQAEKPRAKLTAYFVELAFPIVGDNNARRGLQSLLLSFQARRDVYKSRGPDGGGQYGDRLPYPLYYYDELAGDWTFYPQTIPEYLGSDNIVKREQAKKTTRLGLRYAPTENLVLRTAWSTSFQPPLLGQIYSYREGYTYGRWFSDPYHPDGLTGLRAYTVLYKPVNPDLRPESSDNYSLAFEWTPAVLPGFRWSMDWSRIDFTDKITGSETLILTNRFRNATFKNPEIVERDEAGYITQINAFHMNIAKKVSELLNAGFEYAFETQAGAFTAGLDYTRVLEEYSLVTEGSEPIERKGTPYGSNEYFYRGALSWIWTRWTADMNAYHYPGYETDSTGLCAQAVGRCAATGDPRPPLTAKPLTTVDLTVTYRFDKGIRVRVGGRNIFNATSRVLWGNLPYDARRWDARGRVLFVDMNWEL